MIITLIQKKFNPNYGVGIDLWWISSDFYDQDRLLANLDLNGTLHPAIGNLSSLLYMWVIFIH